MGAIVCRYIASLSRRAGIITQSAFGHAEHLLKLPSSITMVHIVDFRPKAGWIGFDRIRQGH